MWVGQSNTRVMWEISPWFALRPEGNTNIASESYPLRMAHSICSWVKAHWTFESHIWLSSFLLLTAAMIWPSFLLEKGVDILVQCATFHKSSACEIDTWLAVFHSIFLLNPRTSFDKLSHEVATDWQWVLQRLAYQSRVVYRLSFEYETSANFHSQFSSRLKLVCNIIYQVANKTQRLRSCIPAIPPLEVKQSCNILNTVIDALTGLPSKDSCTILGVLAVV